MTTRIANSPKLIDTTSVDGQFIGVHVLRPVVAVNLNANLDGNPKSLTLDATRMRVSSQARKRAMREWTHAFIERDEQAVRTRKVPGAAAEELARLRDIDYNDALNVIAVLILGVGKFAMTPLTADRTEELAYVPRQTPTLLAQIADTHWDDLADAADKIADERGKAAVAAADTPAKGRGRPKKADKAYLTAAKLPAAIKKQVVDAYAPGASSEIALNGRMLTGLPDAGAVEAATSVAHSYSVDPVRYTMDDWTAKDDWQDGDFDSDKTGAAMMDTRTLGSGCLYEWAALDRRQLRINLAETSGLADTALDDAAHAAEQLFVSSAAWAVPTASSHSTGSVAPPVLVVATVSDYPAPTLPVFETAITSDVTATAANRVADYLTRTATRRHPINGGTVLWMPAIAAPAPTFPAALTIEEG